MQGNMNISWQNLVFWQELKLRNTLEQATLSKEKTFRCKSAQNTKALHSLQSGFLTTITRTLMSQDWWDNCETCLYHSPFLKQWKKYTQIPSLVLCSPHCLLSQVFHNLHHPRTRLYHHQSGTASVHLRCHKLCQSHGSPGVLPPIKKSPIFVLNSRLSYLALKRC